MEEDGEERLRGLRDACARQHASFLQAPGEGPHSGSLCCSSEQIACRADCWIMRQAFGTLQSRRDKSSQPVLLGFSPLEWDINVRAEPEGGIGVAAVVSLARPESPSDVLLGRVAEAGVN